MAIFDHFRRQLTPKVTECLEKYNIHSVLVPASCTDRLQPLDISVNKAAKTFLRSEFQSWYSHEENHQNTDSGDLEPVDISTARLKCVGGQWLVRLFEYLQLNPTIINNGFQAVGIPQSIDAGNPILDESSEPENDADNEDDNDEETDNSVKEGQSIDKRLQ